jgi:pimeloyl-ACP methyl ester carboxylesterase
LLLTSQEQREITLYIEQLKQASPLLLVALNAPNRVWEGAYKPLVDIGKLTEQEGQLFKNAVTGVKRLNAHINWYRANIPSPDMISERDFWPSKDARITAPATFIWGTDDPLITPETTEAIKTIAEDVRFLELQGIGHWPHIENTDKVNEAIRHQLSTRH